MLYTIIIFLFYYNFTSANAVYRLFFFYRYFLRSIIKDDFLSYQSYREVKAVSYYYYTTSPTTVFTHWRCCKILDEFCLTIHRNYFLDLSWIFLNLYFLHVYLCSKLCVYNALRLYFLSSVYMSIVSGNAILFLLQCCFFAITLTAIESAARKIMV